MAKRTLVIGAAYVDIVVGLNRLPQSGEDVTGNLEATQVGGSAFNVQRALTYQGAAADLLAPVGRGTYASIVEQTLADRKIPLLVRDDRADNGWDISLVEADGERTFLTVNGIEQLWCERWFQSVDLSSYDYFYISGYELEELGAAEIILNAFRHRKVGAKVLFDASPRSQYLQPAVLEALFVPGTIVHCNATEASCLMAGETSYQVVAQRIHRLTGEPVVVTLGAEGAYVVDQGQGTRVIGDVARVINTIGAGDSHCGGLLAALAAGQPLLMAVAEANHLAAKVVGQVAGALEHSR
ncbi:PfkB family carbohydrate kinase [Levilactobacillus tongjiangensis]|uniref:PfkB family carbohydrate kinase n=1 Tax=Levilactobacillus tongjiangensis TaxID=2486023 RepID=A0ABW1SR09_9LACO|nr:PfkB family carbohydrate kinase [Levilactobacillus tongjiangensis]